MHDFSDVIGQDAVKEHLLRAVESDRVSHAYLLIGENGMGKEEIADAFAKMLLCEKNPLHPCGVCHACVQVDAGTHPDAVHVTHEKPNSIGVDEVRDQLAAEIMIRPFSGKRRIFIVPDAEKMTQQAQNALLKTIEEPPDYAVILLLTESEEALLETVRSRCVKLKFRPVPKEVLTRALMERFGVSRGEAVLAAEFARGVAGRAKEMVLSVEFRQRCEETLSLLFSLPEEGAEKIPGDISKIEEWYPDLMDFLDFVRMYFRDLLLLKSDPRSKNVIFAGNEERLIQASRDLSPERAGKALEETERTVVRLRANVTADLSLALLLEAVRMSRTKG